MTSKYLSSVLFLMLTLITFAQTDTTKQETITESREKFWKNLPKPTGWMNDFEKLYTDEEKYSLDSIIGSFQKLTTIEIAIVTLDTLVTSKEKFDELTLHIAKTWGVGLKEKNNGILIGISKGHRIIRIQNGYGIEKLISDKETKEIIDTYFIPNFRNGEYYIGTLTGLTKLIELLNSKM